MVKVLPRNPRVVIVSPRTGEKTVHTFERVRLKWRIVAEGRSAAKKERGKEIEFPDVPLIQLEDEPVVDFGVQVECSSPVAARDSFADRVSSMFYDEY